jgi:hypothetical protein
MIDAINAVPMAALAGVEIRFLDAGASRQNRTIQTECGQGSEQARYDDPDEQGVIMFHRAHLRVSTVQRSGRWLIRTPGRHRKGTSHPRLTKQNPGRLVVR